MKREGLAHGAAALLACVLLPGASWLDGRGGWLAWGMYASSASYELRIESFRNGKRRWLAPTELAARAARDVHPALAGADHFRHSPHGPTLRGRLARIAALACELGPADEVELTLRERSDLDAPLRTTVVRSACGRGR